MWKCLRRILEMRGSDGLYVTTKGKRSVESWGLVRKASVRETNRNIVLNISRCVSLVVVFDFSSYFIVKCCLGSLALAF